MLTPIKTSHVYEMKHNKSWRRLQRLSVDQSAWFSGCSATILAAVLPLVAFIVYLNTQYSDGIVVVKM